MLDSLHGAIEGVKKIHNIYKEGSRPYCIAELLAFVIKALIREDADSIWLNTSPVNKTGYFFLFRRPMQAFLYGSLSNVVV